MRVATHNCVLHNESGSILSVTCIPLPHASLKHIVHVQCAFMHAASNGNKLKLNEIFTRLSLIIEHARLRYIAILQFA